MPTEVDIRRIVEKHSSLPIERFRVLRSFEEVGLSQIKRGIIFVFATWSGPAVVAFQRFTKAIKSLETLSLDLVILDTDCLTEDSITQLYDTPRFTPGGWGETIWIRDGRIVARAVAHTASENLIEQHTRDLLDNNAI